MSVPYPSDVRMHVESKEPQNQWYCYERDRVGNTCKYSRHDPEIRRIQGKTPVYFQWSSLNASNSAVTPFRYNYLLKDLTDNNRLLIDGSTADTQTLLLNLPENHNVQFSIKTVDYTGQESLMAVYEFNIPAAERYRE